MRQKWLRQLEQDWFLRISPIFIAVIIVNTVAVFKEYWWPQTFTLIYWTVTVSAISRFLLPSVRRWKRYLSELFIIVLLSYYYADVKWNGVLFNQAENKLLWLLDHIIQLHPFIGLAFIVYAIHTLYSDWITKRPRLYLFTGVALLVVCIRDSFSSLILWYNIAFIVFSFLVWHTLLHLHSLQQKHRQSFKELWEYPSALIAPFLIILALLIFAGTIAPAKPPVLQDPYTIWKQSRGEEVPAFLGEKGLIATFQLQNQLLQSSGYSRDDEQLGGSFQFNHEPVMEIYTTHKSYWRGESRWSYNGKGWDDHTSLYDNSQWAQVTLGADFSTEHYPLAETIEVEQTVTFIGESTFPVLFTAAKPFQIDAINKAGDINNGEENEMEAVQVRTQNQLPLPFLRWLNEDSRLEYLSDRTNEEVRSYTVKSNVLLINEEGLRESDTRLLDDIEQDAYTSLPDSLPERVFELAEQITLEANNDYDRAVMLEQYLRMNYVYTNKPDTSKLSGSSDDFVDQFLFELMEGYCDYFSTAMVVMARTLDMPARWVKGFAPGISEQERYMQMLPFIEEEEQSFTKAASYTVRNSDAHSWVEIYFTDYGWVSFEPTPGFRFPHSAVENSTFDESVLLLDDTEDSNTFLNQVNSINFRIVWNILFVVLGLFIVYAVIRYTFMLVKRKTARMSINERIIHEVHQFLVYCKWRGLKRKQHHTLRETIEQWNHGSEKWQQELKVLLHYYELASYSKKPLTLQELEHLREIKKYLKNNWNK